MSVKQSTPTQHDPKGKPSKAPMKDLINAATTPVGKKGAETKKRERK